MKQQFVTAMMVMMGWRSLSAFFLIVPQMQININVGEGKVGNPKKRKERGGKRREVVDSIIYVCLLLVI
jgi:hypothetical protein